MRAASFVVALFLAWLPRAQAQSEVFLVQVEDVRGARAWYRTGSDRLARTPEWRPESEDPPLAVPAAARIGLEAGKRRLASGHDMVIESILLQKKEFSRAGEGRLVRWYYQVTLSRIIDRHAFHPSSTTIVVLLDGSVVEPTPVK